MRHFVTFRKNTTLHEKVMVFTNLLRNEVQDRLVQFYDQQWDKIYTEPEASRVLHETLLNSNNWVVFGVVCKTIDDTHSVSVDTITDWFKQAVPSVKPKNIATQLGAHIEEITELLSVLKSKSDNVDLQNKAVEAYVAMNSLKTYLYNLDKLPEFTKEDKVEILDALADQVVTATGTAYMLDFKFDKALTEVNQSNWSKFEDGKPVFNENGKIIKGKNYFKPNLTDFI